MSALIIHNVDLRALERQRLQLVELSFNDDARKHMTPAQKSALDGVINMLDAWSDGREES